MHRKRYGTTTRSFLSPFVLYALSFNVQAETWLPIGTDSAVSNDVSIAESTPVFVDSAGVYPRETPAMTQLTPELAIRIFPSAPRANIEKYLPIMRRALAENGLVDKTMILMALATVRAETPTFDPIGEIPSALNTTPPGPPFNKYDWRRDLGNMGPPDGAMFKGRGFIQLTGRKNYKFFGDMLGYDLIGNPELASTPQPAAQILAAYLKVNETSIRSALAVNNLAAARKIVNGGANGLDSFRAAFLAGNLLIHDYPDYVAISKDTQSRPRPVSTLKSRDTEPTESYPVVSEEAENPPNGRGEAKKGKGFFLFRPFRR